MGNVAPLALPFLRSHEHQLSEKLPKALPEFTEEEKEKRKHWWKFWTLKRKRCSHKWHPRTPKLPRVCPKCKSAYWNQERKRKRALINDK